MINDTLLQDWYGSVDVFDRGDSIELHQKELSEHPKIIIIEKHSLKELVITLLNYVP